MMRRGFNKGFRIFLIVIIIVSCFIIIGNIFVYNYYLKLSKINAAGSSDGTVTLIVEAYSPGAEEAAPAAGGGGGGGGVTRVPVTGEVVYDFFIDQALVKVSTKTGESFKKSVTITNPNDVSLNFIVSTNLEGMVFISDARFDIPAKSEKTIFLTFVATEDIKADVYTGIVKFRTQYSQKELPIVYEVRTKKALFDVSVNIPARYKFLKPGDDLFFQVTLLNLGEIGRVDVDVEYDIKDFYGNVITSLADIVAVETQASFSKTIKLPSDISSGDYVVVVRAKYDLTVATASDLFSIGKEVERAFRYIIWIIIVLIILVLIIIIFRLRKMQLKRAVVLHEKRIGIVKERIKKGISNDEALVEIKRLNSQKELLKQAYNKGYIKWGSYESGIRKTDELIKKLRLRR